MQIAEATRQFQATLEARRALRHQTEGAFTFEEERRTADVEVARAEAALFKAWMAEPRLNDSPMFTRK